MSLDINADTEKGISSSDPIVVDWSPDDPECPFNWPNSKKWRITAQVALNTFTVSFCSSSYSGGLKFIQRDLGVSQDVAILGISLYVLGFGLGPLVWAPVGEACSVFAPSTFRNRSHCSVNRLMAE
jgi:hypothetical protein